MKNVEYTQVWGMAEWMEQNFTEVGRAFAEVEQVAWLLANSYPHTVKRSYEARTDNFHITMMFTIPDEAYTFLVLKWPETTIRVDFMGPTIKETRS